MKPGDPRETDNKLDSFRHAIWHVTMAKMGYGLKKEKYNWALQMGFAHELGTKYKGVASEMDWHNNTVGIEYYLDNSKKTYTTTLGVRWESGVSEPTYGEAARELKKKALAATFVDEKTHTSSQARTAMASVNGGLVYVTPDPTDYQ